MSYLVLQASYSTLGRSVEESEFGFGRRKNCTQLVFGFSFRRSLPPLVFR